MELENLLVIAKLQLLAKQICFPNIITNNKNELWKTVGLTSVQKPQMESFPILLNVPIRFSFCISCVICTFFYCFEQLFLCLPQYGSSSHCLYND